MKKGLLGCYFLGQKYFEYGYEREKIIEETTIFLDEAKVWKVLAQIPYGETMTYGEIAEKINCGSAQAVGGAVGKNPLSIIVPCHRVLGNQGQLTGYVGGVEGKCWLLEHEKANF